MRAPIAAEAEGPVGDTLAREVVGVRVLVVQLVIDHGLHAIRTGTVGVRRGDPNVDGREPSAKNAGQEVRWAKLRARD